MDRLGKRILCQVFAGQQEFFWTARQQEEKSDFHEDVHSHGDSDSQPVQEPSPEGGNLRADEAGWWALRIYVSA